MSTQLVSKPSATDIPALSIDDMTPSTRHFVSLKVIYDSIHKRFPTLTSGQFRGWNGRRKLNDAGAVFHGRMSKSGDNFLEKCFLPGKSPLGIRRYELKLAKSMEAYLSEEENVGAIRTMILRYAAPQLLKGDAQAQDRDA